MLFQLTVSSQRTLEFAREQYHDSTLIVHPATVQTCYGEVAEGIPTTLKLFRSVKISANNISLHRYISMIS